MPELIRFDDPRVCSFCPKEKKVFVKHGENFACLSCHATLIESNIAGDGDGENQWNVHPRSEQNPSERERAARRALRDLTE